jgi:hypothetical protein
LIALRPGIDCKAGLEFFRHFLVDAFDRIDLTGGYFDDPDDGRNIGCNKVLTGCIDLWL